MTLSRASGTGTGSALRPPRRPGAGGGGGPGLLPGGRGGRWLTAWPVPLQRKASTTSASCATRRSTPRPSSSATSSSTASRAWAAPSSAPCASQVRAPRGGGGPRLARPRPVLLAGHGPGVHGEAPGEPQPQRPAGLRADLTPPPGPPAAPLGPWGGSLPWPCPQPCLAPTPSRCLSLAPPALAQGTPPGPRAHPPAPSALSGAGGAPPTPGLSQPLLPPSCRPQESGGSAGQAPAPRLAAGPGERLSQPEARLRGSARPPPAAQMTAGVRGGARPSPASPDICCLPRQEAHPGEAAWREGPSEELPSQMRSCLQVPRARLLLLKPGRDLLASGPGKGLLWARPSTPPTPPGAPQGPLPLPPWDPPPHRSVVSHSVG